MPLPVEADEKLFDAGMLEAGDELFDAGLQGFGWFGKPAWWVRPAEAAGRSRMPLLVEAAEELFDAGLQGFGWFGKPAWWVRPAEAVGRNTIPPLDTIGGKLGPGTDTAPSDEVATTTSPLGTPAGVVALVICGTPKSTLLTLAPLQKPGSCVAPSKVAAKPPTHTPGRPGPFRPAHFLLSLLYSMLLNWPPSQIHTKGSQVVRVLPTAVLLNGPYAAAN